MANEKNIKVNSGSDENLHSIMEALEGISARTKELGAVAGQYDEMKDTVERLQARCDELDKQLPQGGKVFSAETPTKTSTLREFGGYITEGWRLKQYGRTSASFAGQTRDANNHGDSEAGGGVLVPEITYDKVMRIVEEASIARRICQVIPMTSNTMVLPTRSSGPSVGWLANQPNSDAATKTGVAFDSPSLTSKTLMAIDEISAELDEDSIVALEPFFAQIFAEAVGKEENKQTFVGNTAGSPADPFMGVAFETGVAEAGDIGSVGSATFSDVTYNDLLNLQYAVDPNLVNKGVFVMNSQAFKEVIGLKDSQDRPIFATGYSHFGLNQDPADPQSGQATMLLGRPCYLTDVMPTTDLDTVFAIYGDFSKFAFGDRKQLTIDWSDQVYYEYGNLALRVRERIALKVIIAAAFSRIKTARAN